MVALELFLQLDRNCNAVALQPLEVPERLLFGLIL